MKNMFVVKFHFILWSFFIFIGSASAKEIQCSLMLESNSYFVNVTPLSDQTYHAKIVVVNNQNKTLNLLGQYKTLESRLNLKGNETLVYSDRQRQFALYIQTPASFLTANLNNSIFKGEKISSPLNCQIINIKDFSINCCSLCNPNCQGSGLPACPILPGSCH